MVQRYSLDDGGVVVPADQRATAAEAAAAANTKTSDSFTVQRTGLNVVVNRVYPFSFAYLYDNPDNPSEPIVGPRSPNFLITLQTPDLTQPVTNLVVTPGLLSYGVKWDLIDKALPANKWLIDIQIYESLTGAFAGEEYLVWNGNGNSATILVSNTANRWIRVDTRDQDYRKKSVFSARFNATDPIVVDTTGPANVNSVTTSGGLDTIGVVGFNGYADISWPAVTGGGIRGYRIRFRPVTTPESSYSYADSPGTGTSYRLAGLGAGLVYEIAVATYDEYNNTSSSYVPGTNVTVGGTPYIASTVDVSGFFRAKANPNDADSTAFKFGYGIETGKRGLLFNASNYWHIDSNQSALFKVGGPTANYLLWNGTKLTVDGDINAKGGNFSGNIFMSTSGASIYNGTIDSTTGNLTGNGFALNSTGLKVANGTKSVTISAATGTITANGGSIGSWNITDTTLSKNNIILDSAGTIQVGSSASASVYLKSSGDFVMWAGNNTPDANAKFRIGSDGTLYANGAVFGTGTSISGYATSGQLATTNTNLATTNSNLATTNSNLATTNTNVTNATNSIATKLTKSTNTITDSNNNMTAINAGGITVYSGTSATNGARVVMNSEGIAGYNSSNQATFSVLASTGAAVFKGDITGASGVFSGPVRSNITDPATSSYFDSQGSLGGVSSGLVIGAIGFKNTDVGGWTSHCYPYMPGSPNIDLGTVRFRWNDVRISGSVMVGHGGTDTIGLASGPKTRLYPNGNIYADTLGTTTRAPASGVTLVQGTDGFLRVYSASSSRKYKDNIEYKDTPSIYNLMKDLSPVTFRYKPEFSDLPEEIHYGLIAEDVHEIDPGNSLVIYKDGLPDSVKYENIPMHLVGAFKEMAKKIDILQSRLDALEG